MKFETFERLAWREWERIPERYREGVDGLIVSRQARPHPSLPDIYTMGECVTEEYLSDYSGPDTVRSAVILYYGSFERLSRLDPDFDWEAELWETLTHELQHHLESLASDDGLADVDYAVDENFKRHEGAPFEPLFYRAGEDLGGGWYAVEDALFLERTQEEGAAWVDFELDGESWRVAMPDRPAEVHFVDVERAAADGRQLCIVLVRRTGIGGVIRDLFTRRRPTVLESRAEAVPR